MGRPFPMQWLLAKAKWVAALLALLALWLGAWPLVWRLAILPNLDASRQGLRMETYAQEEATGPVVASRLAGPQDFFLGQPYTSLRARGVWMVPRDGEYRLRLTCDDHGGLTLDRRQLILLHGSSGAQAGYYRLRLDMGPHFLHVVLHNRQGQGWAKLDLAPPGGADYAPIPADQLHPLDLGNLDVWLQASSWLEQGALAGLGGLLGAWLCLAALGGAASEASPWTRRTICLLTFLAFAALWRQELGWALGRALSHDEHQFIASAVLLAREGLWPYADFPYFHAPYLIGLYALIFPHVESPLLAARWVAAMFALGSLGLVFWGAARALGRWPLVWGWGLAMGLTLLMSQEDVFRFTSGLAWNHDAATFLALSALIFAWNGLFLRENMYWLAASGLLLACAAGVRLSFAPLALAFLLMALARPRIRWRATLAWAIGAFLGSLPFLAYLIWQPGRTFFGNLTYPLLNTRYKGGQGIGQRLAQVWRERIITDGMDWEKFFSPSRFDALILMLAALALLVWLWAILRRRPGMGQPALAWASLPLLLLGALAPNPLQIQYIYPLVPFTLLALALTWGQMPFSRRFRPALMALLLYLAIAMAWSAGACPPALASQCPWHAPAQIHRLGQQIAALSPPGRILTLTPELPLEGGLSIYPPLAASPFSWRVAPMLSSSRRIEQGLISHDDLPHVLNQSPPSAILLGWEKSECEAPIKELAPSLGYREIPLAPGLFLWMK